MPKANQPVSILPEYHLEPAALELAVALEQSRRHLSGLIETNPYAADVLAGELLNAGARRGMHAQYRRMRPDAAQEAAVSSPEPQRYLPVFLIHIADLLAKHAPADGFTPDYKLELAAGSQSLQTLRQKMINANIGLAAFAAHKFTTGSLGFNDLMQEGILGLIKAVDRFDPQRGICFSTYAMYWIKQAISRLVGKQEKIVRLPQPLAEKAATLFEAMRTCYLLHERWPTMNELKKVCALPEQDVRLISSYYQATHSLDTPLYDGEDDRLLMEKLPQHQYKQPPDELADAALSLLLERAVASLPEKQAAILSMRFGLQNQSEMTLQAIADQLQVTRERVRQIQNEALNKLKQQFGYELVPFLDANE